MRRKDPKAHFAQARLRGAQDDTGIVNEKPVLKELQDCTEKSHQRQLDLWFAYVKSLYSAYATKLISYRFVEDDPPQSVNSLKSLKAFIKSVALGMDGQRGYDSDSESDTDGECQCLPICKECARKHWIPPCVESVRNYWNNFTGAWKREYAENPIPEVVRESVTQVRLSLISLLRKLILYTVHLWAFKEGTKAAREQASKTIWE